MTDPTQSTFPRPRAAKAASAGFGERAESLSAPGMSSAREPQPWPFLQPAQSLGGMIQQKPGSHQVLLQPESSEVSLGSLADLCNQGEVV